MNTSVSMFVCKIKARFAVLVLERRPVGWWYRLACFIPFCQVQTNTTKRAGKKENGREENKGIGREAAKGLPGSRNRDSALLPIETVASVPVSIFILLKLSVVGNPITHFT